MRRAWLICLALCALPLKGQATELAPWFGNDKEFELRTSYLLQHYDQLHTNVGKQEAHSTDHFLSVSLAISPFPCLAVETELQGRTSSQRGGFDFEAVLLTGRYNWLNDVVGDSCSLSTGVTLLIPHGQSLRDRATLYHSDVDVELHLSVGREQTYGYSWASRFWALAAIGQGTSGHPWLRAQANYEYNYCDQYIFHLFTQGRLGLGSEDLDLSTPFSGYGSIAHRHLEIGVRGTRTWLFNGTLGVELTQGLVSSQSPLYVTTAQVIYLYTFGI